MYIEKRTESVRIESESLVVAEGKSFLTEVPDEFYRVNINGYVEIRINQAIKNTNEFKVKYETGEIFFHSSKEAESIIVDNYYGKGVIMYPASRIYTDISGGLVNETLNNVVNDSKSDIELFEQCEQIREASENIRISNEIERKNQEVARKSNFEKMIQDGYVKLKPPVETYNDIKTIYTNPENGWTTRVINDGTNTGKMYRYNSDITTWEYVDKITTTAYDALLDGFAEQYSTPQTVQQAITSFPSDTKNAKILHQISGETLFNYGDNGVDYGKWTLTGTGSTKSADGIHLVQDGGNDGAWINTNLSPSTQYTLVYNIKSSYLDGTLFLYNHLTGSHVSLSKTIGINKVVITTQSTISTNKVQFFISSDGTDGRYIDIELYAILEGDHTNTDINSELPFGISHSIVDLQKESKNLFYFDTVYQGITENFNSTDSVIGYIKVKPNTHYSAKVFETSLPVDGDDRLWIVNAKYIGEYSTANDYISENASANIGYNSNTILTSHNTNYLVVCTYGGGAQNYKKNLYSKIMLVEGTAIPTIYEPYKSKTLQPNIILKSVQNISDKLRNAILVGDKLQDLDTIEHIQNISDDIVLDGTRGWTDGVDLGTVYRFYISLSEYGKNVKGEVSRLFLGGTEYSNLIDYSSDSVHHYISSNNQTLFLFVEKTIINAQTGATSVDKLKNYLAINNGILIYQLETPITIKLPNQSELWSYANGRLINNSIVQPLLTYSVAQNNVAQGQGNTQVLQKHEKHLEMIDDEIDILKDEIFQSVSQQTTILTNASPTQHITVKQNCGVDVDIGGELIVNFLGKDGDCEDISKWTFNSSTLVLDSNNNVVGDNCIKITINGSLGWGNMHTYITDQGNYKIDKTKYYLTSAYLKNGNGTNVRLNTAGGSDTVTDTNMTRVGVKTQPNDFTSDNYMIFDVTGSDGQYGYVDGIMINEITQDEYNNLTVDQLLAKYPYTNSAKPLLNPTVEVVDDTTGDTGQIIFPTELAKIDTYQDKLTYKEGKCEVDRRVKHVVLDGSLDWVFVSDHDNFKIVKIMNGFENSIINSQIVCKYDDSILSKVGTQWDISDKAQIYSPQGELIISISDIDSGWGEGFTPNVDEIKAYFNGWKMYTAGNGTSTTYTEGVGTKAWTQIGYIDDGTKVTATLPTIISPSIIEGTINHYQLYYALQEPLQEEMQPIILGDGINLVEGQNTLIVKSGCVWEKAKVGVNATDYVINRIEQINPLSYHAKQILRIYKETNGELIDDTNNWFLITKNNNYYNGTGAFRDIIEEATYYVLYEVIQEDYNCQVQEVSMSYENNIRGTLNEVVEHTSNNEKIISELKTCYKNIELLKSDDNLETVIDKINEILNLMR